MVKTLYLVPTVEIFSTNKFEHEDFNSTLHFCRKWWQKVDENNSDRRISFIHVTKYARQYVFNICSSIMKANLYKFSIVLRKCNYLDSSQIYKRHFNRFINIFKHCWLRSRATLKRPPYCVHKYFMPQHVLSRNFRKNRNSGWLIDILQCNLWAS